MLSHTITQSKILNLSIQKRILLVVSKLIVYYNSILLQILYIIFEEECWLGIPLIPRVSYYTLHILSAVNPSSTKC